MKLKKTLTIKTVLALAFVFSFGLFFVVSAQQSQSVRGVNNVAPVSLPKADDLSASSIEIALVDDSVSIAFVGDVNFDRLVGENIVFNNQDPFAGVSSELQKHNIVVANLETVIASPQVSYRNTAKLYTFNSSLESLPYLAAHVDVVSLANNHTRDFGNAALLNTIDNLHEYSIAHFGAGANDAESFKPLYFQYGEYTFAFIGVNGIETYFQDSSASLPGSAYFDEAKLRPVFEAAEARADFTFVLPHWGNEYSLQPNQFQREWAHKFVEWGADAIVGAHPHVLQPLEYVDGVPVHYSLGNFIFSGFWGIPNTDKAEILVITVQGDTISEVLVAPVTVGRQGYPALVD